MAVYKSGGGAADIYLERTANLPSQTAFTIGGWFKRNSDRNNYEVAMIYRMVNTTPDPDEYWKAVLQVYPTWDNPPDQPTINHCLVLRNDTGGGTSTWASTLPGTGAWYYWAMTSDGTNHKAYWYDSSFTLVDSFTASIGVGTIYAGERIQIGSDSNDNRFIDGKFCYVRVWDVALSQSEIAAEVSSSVIVKTANINTAIGACTDNTFASDVSGNGRNWTLGAGLSTSDYDSDVPSGLSSGGSSSTITPNVAAMSV